MKKNVRACVSIFNFQIEKKIPIKYKIGATTYAAEAF